jgi:hypothetical protein
MPAVPSLAGLVRGLVATAAASSPLSVDRFQDLLVLSSRLTAEMTEASDVDAISLRMATDEGPIELVVVGRGDKSEMSRLSALAMDRLSDRWWQVLDEDGLEAGFVMT